MKKNNTLHLLIPVTLICIIILSYSCKKNDTNSDGDTTPSVTTSSSTMVGQRWATINGTVNAKDQLTIASFEFDSTTSYLKTFTADPDTVEGTTVTTVSAHVLFLKPAHSYHFRIKAVNPSGTSYGNDQTFTTTNASKDKPVFNTSLSYGSVTDYDGNVYKTIQIGNQTWMAENLRTMSYSDGTVIPFYPENAGWVKINSPGFCWYDNDSLAYGALYNWYVVDPSSNGGKNVCPTGWHVPTDDEWTAMSANIGGEAIAGGKLKEAGTKHWYSTTSSVINEFGFTAIPAGYRSATGGYNSIRRYGYWWTSTGTTTSAAYCRDINYSYNNFEKSNSSMKSGLSVRCIKNN